ncbi:MAG: zinc-binding dehydrogenase [Trueperaceae bacterium]|nr:zinc-binding dehydrogenase [Trueperaceae bacterium]
MRAILVDAPRGVPTPTTVPDPEPPAHGAVIAVRATGVCRSDWHAWVGHDPTVRWPHVPGHEFAGEVVAVGPDVRGDWLRERVTAPFCCGCGGCATCRDGSTHLCEREFQPGFDGWGSFAEFVAVPWADVNLSRLPEGLGFDEAASLGCRFMTAFHGLVDRAALRAGETVAVFGCGGVGLAAVAIAAAAGARVVAVDLVPEKLALARELGAFASVDATRGDAVTAVVEATAGGADVTVDALGSRVTSAQGIRALRPRGRHVQLGLLLGGDADPALPLQRVVRHELTVVGGHGMPARAYPRLFSFLERGRVPLGRLIGERRPLGEAGAALAAMERFAPVGVTLLHP